MILAFIKESKIKDRAYVVMNLSIKRYINNKLTYLMSIALLFRYYAQVYLRYELVLSCYNFISLCSNLLFIKKISSEIKI